MESNLGIAINHFKIKKNKSNCQINVFFQLISNFLFLLRQTVHLTMWWWCPMPPPPFPDTHTCTQSQYFSFYDYYWNLKQSNNFYFITILLYNTYLNIIYKKLWNIFFFSDCPHISQTNNGYSRRVEDGNFFQSWACFHKK